MNTPQDSYVRARIDAATKERATHALSEMGLSVSEAIRLLLVRVAHEGRLPFAVKVPNTKTLHAIEELEAGEGISFASVNDVMAHVHEED